MKFAFVGITAVTLLTTVAQAQVKLEGSFMASKACDAVVSIKKGTNPDNAAVVSGTSYQLLGKNSDNATHYWINVPQADPKQRWVDISCGSTDANQVTKSPAQDGATAMGKPSVAGAAAGGAAVNTDKGTVRPKPTSRGFRGGAPYYAFALSWEPTFCEAMRDKVECRTQTPQSFQATHFTIHGLWPQPRRNQFCNVDAKLSALDDQHQWDALPEPQISAQTRAALTVAMPGVQSNLQRHEWIKHGTCYPANSAEQYFKDELRLAAEVNGSAVQQLFASNIGKQISAAQIRSAFDQSFSKGAGDNVQVECDKQGRLAGFTMNLRGDIPSGANLSKLLLAGDQAQNKCDGGLVDAVR